RAGGGDGRTAEARVGNREVETDVAPAELLDGHAHAEVLLGRSLALLPLAAVAGHRRAARDAPHHVEEVPGLLVLLLVALARDRTHRLLGEHVRHGAHVLHAFGGLEVDHGRDSSRNSVQTMASPSSVPKLRASRSSSSTRWSRM